MQLPVQVFVSAGSVLQYGTWKKVHVQPIEGDEGAWATLKNTADKRWCYTVERALQNDTSYRSYRWYRLDPGP